jgi:hypothetical protein
MAKKISASDIFAEEDIFLGIRNSAEKTILTFQEIDAEVKKLGANIKKDLSGADFGNTKGINAFVSATQKANDAKNKSIQIDKVLVQATKDVAAADKALIEIEIKKQKLVQEEIRTATQKAKIEQANANAVKKTAEASKVQMDTYKQLAASTRDFKNQSKELGAQLLASEKAGKSGTAAYAQLEQQFKEVTIAAQAGDAELKQIDKTVGDNFRNVGNYEGATKGLKQQLREMTQALQNMESTDPRFKQMTIDAGELKDKIQDTNAVIKSTAGSAVENLGTGIAKAGKVGIDAFAGMTGAMGLFGIESEGAMQAMLKLQQLAAMSEALTSLGALGDTVTEVKASFIAAATKLGLFTSAKVVDTAVTETQVVATNAATVSTNFLGKAMKALPIIAIIAGIAALAYGIYSLVSGNEAAAEATKKRLAAEKAANEEAKATAKFVSEESAQFVGLIYQLKATNQTSKERSVLINKINLQYGTTLKNLSDENLFQEQLNQAVQDYIDLSYNKLKLQKNEKYFQQNLEKKLAAEAEFGRIVKENTQFYEMFGITTGTATDKLNAYRAKSSEVNTELRAQEDIMLAADIALNSLGLRHEQLSQTQTKLTKGGKVYVEQTGKNNNSTETNTKLTKENNLVLETNIQLLERENKARKSLFDTAELERILLLDEGRAVLSSEIAVTEGEIALAKANQSGNTKDIVKAEQDLRKLKEAQIKAQLQLDLAKTDDINERTKLEKQAELDIINLGNGKIEGAEKASLENRLKTQEEFIKLTTDFFIKNSEKKIAQMDIEIAKAQSQYTILQQLAANGNINAQESLAEQQRIINEANARKEKELKRQQRIKLAESVYSTYNSKVAAGSEHPLMDTIKDTMLLQQFIASLPTFYDGTEDTGKNGNGIDGKGGFHAVLHPNERVIPKSLNEQIGGLSNEALAKIASEYQNGKIIRSNSQIGSAFDTAILVNELKTLNETIKAKPETNINIGEITQSVMEIVKSTKQGNTTTYNRYKVRR